MNIITILGAEVMGSATATPLTDAGHRVRLWGTHSDDHLVAAVRSGDPHPRTGMVVPPEVTSCPSSDIDVAMVGADVVVLAVSPPGVVDTARLAAPFLMDVRAVWFTPKGFALDGSGRVQLLPQVVEEVLAREETHIPSIVAIDGPRKASEVASRHPTAPVLAATETLECQARMTTTRQYRVAHTTNRDGVELYTALRNVYAIALGIVDGVGELGNQPFHDLEAAAFAWALAELRLLLDTRGADSQATFGLASAGNLGVTGLPGRNKVYGMRVGGGERADEVLAEMIAAEQTVKGIPAIESALRFARQRHPRLIDDPPLLAAVHAVMYQGRTADDIKEAALSS